MSLKIISLKTYRTRAFTLLESLLVLFLVSLLALSLSGSVKTTLAGVEEKLFLLSFERLYLDSQKLSASLQSPVRLTITDRHISNGYQTIALPLSVVSTDPKTIDFSAGGGNSSLSKVSFATSSETVTYQLYIGSGKYKKTSQSLHSP